MKFEIKHRFSGHVLFTAETESRNLAVEFAVKTRAYLRCADLGGADPRGADLRGAKLTAGDGTGLLTVGPRPVLQIGPIGSRADTLTSFLTDHGVHVRAGCFWDTLAAFMAAVAKKHERNDHAHEYAAAVALIQMHARPWTPKAESPEAA
jgi:hypothetical protein